MDGFFGQSADWASAISYAAAIVGCLYALCAAWVAHRFARGATVPAKSYPAVTVLKPLHGTEPGLYANLARFCAQDYPSPLQVVFGVVDPADPAIAIVRRLIAAFPDCDLRLVINSRRHGVNRKVSNLINMVGEARHEVLIVSDSDIIVEADYLKSMIGSLDRPGVGLATCLYSGAALQGVWARFGAAAINYHFLPNVLVGLKLGLAEPCFGSTIAIRKTTLAAVGGFESIAEQLADDYAIGARVRNAGLKVEISRTVVAHNCTQKSAFDLFRHELRCARTIRSVDPFGFVGLAITHAVPLSLLGMLFGGLTWDALIVVAALVCRFALQAELDRAFRLSDRFYWMGPLRDIMSFVVFVMSFFGRDIEWRGHRYGVLADSTLAYYGEVE